MSEHQEQVKLVNWFRLQYPKFAYCLFAIPNGGKRDIRTALKLKNEGVVAGVPDLFLMIPKAGWHGMFIEMKTEKGRLTESQKNFMGLATLLGYQSVVAYGFSEAQKLIHDYMGQGRCTTTNSI